MSDPSFSSRTYTQANKTALMYAAGSGKVPVVKLLVQKEAKIDAQNEVRPPRSDAFAIHPDKSGRTHFDLTCTSSHLRVCEYLPPAIAAGQLDGSDVRCGAV